MGEGEGVGVDVSLEGFGVDVGVDGGVGVGVGDGSGVGLVRPSEEMVIIQLSAPSGERETDWSALTDPYSY